MSFLGYIVTGFCFYLLITYLYRKSQEKTLWEQWNNILSTLDRNPSYCFGQVAGIRQHARTGTKAYVHWNRGRACEALWIPGVTLKKGQYILVSGSEGNGRHHNEPVFFAEELYAQLPHYAEKSWKNYNNKIAFSQESQNNSKFRVGKN